MEQAFEELVAGHQEMLTAYLHAIVRDKHLAEDLLQETFVSAYRARRQLAAVKNVAAWLRTVARNHAVSFLRKRGSALAAAWQDECAELLVDRVTDNSPGIADHLAALAICRERLPDRQRSMVERFYDRSESAQQVAVEMGVAPNTVFQTLWLARKNLRECIEQQLASAEAKR
jgi:RNA polymerase sigma-70 factor (ECF subfamily)